MARVDEESRELKATIVVYGARESGKSSLLRALRDRLLAPASDADRTLPLRDPLLDWLPLDLGIIGSWRVRLDLYAISSRVESQATRRLVLAEADGVIVMIDSQAARIDDNLAMMRALENGLTQADGSVRTAPRVLCYSKQDLPGELILTPAALDTVVNLRGDRSFGVDLLRGRGALDPLHPLVTQVLKPHAVPQDGA